MTPAAAVALFRRLQYSLTFLSFYVETNQRKWEIQFLCKLNTMKNITM